MAIKTILGLYAVQDSMMQATEDFDWLVDNYGPPNELGRWFYSASSNTYYFKRERDAMLFELGWSHAANVG